MAKKDEAEEVNLDEYEAVSRVLKGLLNKATQVSKTSVQVHMVSEDELTISMISRKGSEPNLVFDWGAEEKMHVSLSDFTIAMGRLMTNLIHDDDEEEEPIEE